MTNYLFVYGTLRPRFDNRWSRYLAERSTLTGEGIVEGRLLLLDWYPGMIEGEGEVTGDLLELTGDADETLEALADYEGEEFAQVGCVVTLADGSRHEAVVYRYIGPTEGFPVIGAGVFTPQD